MGVMGVRLTVLVVLVEVVCTTTGDGSLTVLAVAAVDIIPKAIKLQATDWNFLKGDFSKDRMVLFLALNSQFCYSLKMPGFIQKFQTFLI